MEEGNWLPMRYSLAFTCACARIHECLHTCTRVHTHRHTHNTKFFYVFKFLPLNLTEWQYLCFHPLECLWRWRLFKEVWCVRVKLPEHLYCRVSHNDPQLHCRPRNSGVTSRGLNSLPRAGEGVNPASFQLFPQAAVSQQSKRSTVVTCSHHNSAVHVGFLFSMMWMKARHKNMVTGEDRG